MKAFLSFSLITNKGASGLSGFCPQGISPTATAPASLFPPRESGTRPLKCLYQRCVLGSIQDRRGAVLRTRSRPAPGLRCFTLSVSLPTVVHVSVLPPPLQRDPLHPLPPSRMNSHSASPENVPLFIFIFKLGVELQPGRRPRYPGQTPCPARSPILGRGCWDKAGTDDPPSSPPSTVQLSREGSTRTRIQRRGHQSSPAAPQQAIPQ